MCQSEQQGGQRCASYTRKALAASRADLAAAEAEETRLRELAGNDKHLRGLGAAAMRADQARLAEHKARIAHAMTPAGAKETAAEPDGQEILAAAADQADFLAHAARPDGRDEFRYVIDVAFTDTRPITVDQHTSRVTVMAPDDHAAVATAAMMVMRPAAKHLGVDEVQMPTRTTIIEWEA